jgi:tetratricopeptide (TPR) repeat protein
LASPSFRNPNELVNSAAQLKAKGHIDEALCHLNEAIRIQPDHVEALLQKAMLLWEEKDLLDEALFSFSEAIKYARRTSISAPLWYNKGLLLMKMHKYEESIAYFDEAINLCGTFYGSYNNKGVALGFLGRHDEAIKFFDKAIELGPGEVDALNNRAFAYIKMGQEEKALADIEEALKKNPEYHPAIDTKGFILYSQGDYHNALKEFQKGISLNQDFAELWYHKGLAHFKLEQYGHAIRCYDDALRIRPRFAEAYNDKAVALSKKGDILGAIEQVKRAIALNPSLSDAQINLERLIQASVKEVQNFWDFWNSSKSKRAIAIMLVVFAFGASIGYFIIFPNQTVKTEETVEDGNGLTTTTTSVTTVPYDIPEIYFVVPGLAILVLLAPMLKKAKLGPIELELEESLRMKQLV